jgi:phage terminase large subunit GpA-like protein
MALRSYRGMISLIEQTFAGAGLEAIETAWRPNILWREKRKPSVWATEERRIAAGQSPLSTGRVIPYSHELFPHCVEQMDSADDPNIRQIVIWEGIREGKTNAVCLNIFGRTVTDDPGNVYSVLPTDDDRDKFSNDDIEPMIDVCLDEYFVKKKSRDPGRTIGYKRFRGGSIRLVSARSVTKFRGTSVKLLMLHELDALDPESIYKAFGRTKGFGDAIIILESTCTIAPTYNQDGANRVSQRTFTRRTTKAIAASGSAPAGVAMRSSSSFTSSSPGRKATWPKPSCSATAAMPSTTKSNGASSSETRDGIPPPASAPTNCRTSPGITAKPAPSTPPCAAIGGTASTPCSPPAKATSRKLHEFVAEGESAKTSPKKLKTWKNEVAAELWDPSTEGEAPPPWKPIYDRREDYGLTVPAGGLFLTAFVDCQLNRLEIGWRAWGRNEESWGMDHVVLDGHVRDPEVWQMLRHELARKWQHESTAWRLTLGMAFVDGGHYAEDVYRFFQNLARNPVPE